MKKNWKAILVLVLAFAMVFSMAACGKKSEEAAPAEEAAEEGKVLNIWCWNDEFQSRFNEFYPEVDEVAEDKSTTTLKDGTVVKWTINPNEGNNYQDKLDEALLPADFSALSLSARGFALMAIAARKRGFLLPGAEIDMDRMSNVLLESAACGRPVITTDRPGCKETLDDGVTGFVVKQRSSEDLIEKIEKFLSLSWEARREMGLAGRAKMEREFDRNVVVKKYLNLIEEITQTK